MSSEGHEGPGLLRLGITQIAAIAPAVETLDERVARLFEQLRMPIYRFLVSAYGDPGEAEEITQEVFLRMYAALADGQKIDNPRAWAFRVAHNLAVKPQRLSVQDVGEIGWSQLCQATPDAAPNPEQQILADERDRWIRERAATLSALQRSCLLLRVEGFRYREIADTLGVSVSTVAESIRRAVRRLGRSGDA